MKYKWTLQEYIKVLEDLLNSSSDKIMVDFNGISTIFDTEKKVVKFKKNKSVEWVRPFIGHDKKGNLKSGYINIKGKLKK